MQRTAAIAAGLVIAAAAAFAARTQTTPYVPKQTDRPSPVDGDEPGFVPIFDGTSLAGWERPDLLARRGRRHRG